MNGWKVLLAPGAIDYLPCGEFVVPHMGGCKAELMKSPSSASVMIYRVLTELEEWHVEMFLVQGSQELVKEKDWEHFSKLKVCRLYSQTPTNAPGAETQ